MFGIFWFAEGEPKDSKQITKALSAAKGQDSGTASVLCQKNAA